MEQTTYVGIYLIIPNKMITKIISHYVTESGKSTKSKFCSETGKENKLFGDETKVDIERPNTNFSEYESLTEDEMLELDDNTFDTYSDNRTFILIGDEFNKYILSNDYFDEEECIDLSEINVSELMENFTTDYVKYLNAIKKEYGSVEVKFGIVNYWN